MRTQKHISAIAYHRPEVFKVITESLRVSGVIGPCLWIAHKGESGDKPHIHLVLLGGFKVYDTSALGTLWGFDIIDGQKASVSALWKVTKSLNDWLLYGVHNPQYLASKGLEREHAYTFGDIQCAKGDEEIRDEVIREAKDSLSALGDKTTARLIMLAKSGYSWRQVVLSGLVPMGQFSQAAKAWGIICSEYQKGGEVNDEAESKDAR